MDGIVFTTNPPFLGLLGTITKKLFRKRFLYIVYDVYPDILVNLGVISKKGFLHKVLERLSMTILANADCNVVIGRDMLEIIRDKVNISRYGRIKLIPNWSDDQMVYPVQEESNELKKELGAGFDLIVPVEVCRVANGGSLYLYGGELQGLVGFGVIDPSFHCAGLGESEHAHKQ